MMTRALTLDEILAYGQPTSEGCLLWTRTKNGDGYGRIMIARKLWVVHRYVWTVLRGPIPEGMTLDHVCHNRAFEAGQCAPSDHRQCLHRSCFNLDHLEIKTMRDNWLAGRTGMPALNRAKTACCHGHPFDEINTGRDRNGHRFCRACAIIRSRLHKRAKRAAQLSLPQR